MQVNDLHFPGACLWEMHGQDKPSHPSHPGPRRPDAIGNTNLLAERKSNGFASLYIQIRGSSFSTFSEDDEPDSTICKYSVNSASFDTPRDARNARENS